MNRNRKWKSRNSENKTEIDYIPSANPKIMQDFEDLGKGESSDHSMAMFRINYIQEKKETSQKKDIKPAISQRQGTGALNKAT